jgi:phage-related minor tail protein
MSLFSLFGNQGLVSAHATGTVSSGKTGLFGGSPVLIGESGDEAIMPLKRNAAGDLGVVSQGGGASKQGDVNYSISVSIGSVDSADRQAELMKNIEQLITVKTKQTMVEQSRKGNAFAR